jgi:hypothetical protein
VAILHKAGLGQGWMLLTVAEMLKMRQAMEGAAAENEQLSGRTAGFVAAWIADQGRAVAALERMESFCKSMAERQDLPMVFVADALTEIANIRSDLAHFKAHDANATKPPEGK